MSLDYEGVTNDTIEPCACLIGQVMLKNGLFIPMINRMGLRDRLAAVLGIDEDLLFMAEKNNDSFRYMDNDDAACRQRYHYMLGRLDAYAGGEKPDFEDHT